ncbi:MAG: hypothetical protein HC886_23405 [Leptolyngbyaceae cyanobacterium SM1_1_3]|nr:hypothetical protein [Leptolyngbyaceae cyanobacterium SM1_1_3]NJN04655.1 hypothetical protein [Leptolyngbyaceae cyanobacterium RM1_1_2]NJO10506.1 hypothetical protein [Leptolyngbyaceae cyanobacterium SL_1_1]
MAKFAGDRPQDILKTPMSNSVVRDCQPDPERLLPFQECMESYGIDADAGSRDPHDPRGEWPHNCVSTQTVAYSCGIISRAKDTVEHNHEAAELERCRRLAYAAAEIMAAVPVGLGSESEDYFRPFFVTASQGDAAPAVITENTVRAAFGGTLYPPAQISVAELAATGEWWQQMAKTDAATRQAWHDLIKWFERQDELKAAAFVEIGSDPLSQHNSGCVFPRLAVALTAAGSLVGICGYVVYT